ncbi:phage tail sheath family protein [Ralstonia solanacearum]|uniref:phage tail sheath family protein n=1 Tax=Ralstonia solanacearum TaxID=305 RepID=UPI00078D11C7|nr:phage tail sheath C-terminal domain-containing protein [Ralstonia solanacearum]AMP37656.1 phage tail protein [Ralstonia solanacearum]AXV86482.1 phage tail protein [Ralstonia solanacearum]AXW05984.1 phage tail protein [Ralstonia solanacearum]AXW23728.1 phage tail protein [Ralstonia solanacearum]AXW80660.1 phage tail protein [Ralstonia solanacearum]
MPVALSYPGVYVDERPSGVRTITGVATSITAFVGRAAAGPTDDPQMLTSFADYERQFGGLAVDCPMSYAVRDFYLNGGAMALVVRVTHDDAATATITLTGTGSPSADLVLDAASAGGWGNRLAAAVDYDSDRALPRTSPPSTDDTRFNLTVRYQPRAGREDFVVEIFRAVSTHPDDPRYLPRVLERESSYVRMNGTMPPTRPQSNVTTAGSTRTVSWVSAQHGGDGSPLDDDDVLGSQDSKTGIYALNRADLFNLLCIPPLGRDTTGFPSNYTAVPQGVYQAALTLCVERRAMLIVDPDPTWASAIDSAVSHAIDGRNDLNLTGPEARNAALYFPCVRMVDPLRDSRVDTFVPSGIVAGIIARTDVARGVWKAPAGLDAALAGVQDLQVNLNDLENGQLNPLGINCLRTMGVNGRIVWGARTLRGADTAADEYKYLPVRRLALYIEESLYRGTQWVVFEPNDEPLWAQVRLNVGTFMQGLFRQGAFQGTTPRDAYFVKCDSQTTTQNDINLGILNVIVGFAPLKPAEFVVIQIQQMAGQIPT